LSELSRRESHLPSRSRSIGLGRKAPGRINQGMPRGQPCAADRDERFAKLHEIVDPRSELSVSGLISASAVSCSVARLSAPIQSGPSHPNVIRRPARGLIGGNSRVSPSASGLLCVGRRRKHLQLAVPGRGRSVDGATSRSCRLRRHE